jgi:hypothetical protein
LNPNKIPTSVVTQIASKKYEGSVACSAILDQKFVPDTIIDSVTMSVLLHPIVYYESIK